MIEHLKELIRSCNNWQSVKHPSFLFNADTKKVVAWDNEIGYHVPFLFKSRIIKSTEELQAVIREADIAFVTLDNLDETLIPTPIIFDDRMKPFPCFVLKYVIINKVILEEKIKRNEGFGEKPITNTLDDKYKALVEDIIANGIKSGDRTGTGTKKLFGRMIRHSMTEGFPLLTTKKVFWKGILHELVWFLTDCTNIKYLVDNKVYIWVGDCYKRYLKYVNETPDLDVFRPNILGMDLDPSEPTEKGIYQIRPFTQKEFIEQIKTNQEFANEFGALGKVYGSEWTNWEEHINQIQEVMETLVTNPDSRRMLVTAWNPTNVRKALLPSCHYAFQVVTRELLAVERAELDRHPHGIDTWQVEGLTEDELKPYHEEWDKYGVPKRAISLMFNMRSVDVALGLPFDIASYGFLLSMMADCVNMIPEEVICCLADTHLYLDQIEPIGKQLSNAPYNLPKLKFNRKVKNIFDYKIDDFSIENYVSHEKVEIPLSN